ncbi:hypothetical protein ACXDF8_24025 [Mycolicibacterium sp. CBM1]
MTEVLPTQPVLGHAVTAGDCLAIAAADGTVTRWPVLDVTRHPTKLDRVLISGEAGRGVLDLHLSDWVRRIIP